jgi:hypothetical protein
MKKILLLGLLFSSVAFADCDSRSASQMVRDVNTSAIRNLSKSIGPNSCHVQYKLDVDGVEHEVKYTHTGESEGSKLCAQAIERGKNELLVTLAGKYQTETITVCREDRTATVTPAKIGKVVMENELGRVDNTPDYFKYKNSKCRLFRERYVHKNSLRVTHGVICQVDNEDWIVVDKW